MQTPSCKNSSPSVQSCSFRTDVRIRGNTEDAVCQRVHGITGLPTEYCRVAEDACAACCDSPWPNTDQLNPIISSLACDALSRVVQQGGIDSCSREQAEQLKNQATATLELLPRDPSTSLVPARTVHRCYHFGDSFQTADRESLFECHHPRHTETSMENCLACRDWSRDSTVQRMPLHQMIPPPQTRRGQPVSEWAVGITTAPRRHPSLDTCLESLARAGWRQPHLFVDGDVEISERWADCPVTRRQPSVGAWPNALLAMSELSVRHPHADAYMLIQDDAYFYDAANVRVYLEGVLWPGGTPGIVSLYSTDANSEVAPGWHVDPYRWLCGALAFVFPRDVLKQILLDDRIHEYRRSDPRGGTTDVDLLLGEWARVERVPVWYPQPSLVQHIGNTTTIWTGTPNGGLRRARWFAGDLETAFHDGSELDSFNESEFRPSSEHREDYLRRVQQGRERMLQQRTVICGLCRDVRQFLPRTKARIEHLGQMFAEYEVVLFENDSNDDTLAYLSEWSEQDSRVHVLSAKYGFPRYPQIRSRDRASRLAFYRNQYLDFVYKQLAPFDSLIVADTDLRGGWSYDGIADTFGFDSWDAVGSYGIIQRVRPTRPPIVQWRHFDTWAFRNRGHPHAHDSSEIALLSVGRGDGLVPVESSFGGLAIYRSECLREVRYSGEDCEHVRLHARMRGAGFDRQFMNPSQIVVY